MAPPSRNFHCRAAVMKSSSPTRTAPTGQPRPLDRSSQRLSQSSPYCCALALLATIAFISRAPSICSDSPDSFTARETSLSAASDQIAPLYGCCCLDEGARSPGGDYLLARDLHRISSQNFTRPNGA